MSEQNNHLIYLNEVRLSFPWIKEPSEKTKAFSCDFIMDKTHKGYKEFLKIVNQLAEEKWKASTPKVLEHIQGKRENRCFGEGTEKVNSKTFEQYQGYDKKVYISANKKVQPKIIDKVGKPIDPSNTILIQEMASKLYGGCYVNAVIKPWIQDNSFGRAIRCELLAIQFCKDGEPFGSPEPEVTPFFGKVDSAEFEESLPSFLN